jgi:phosphatidylglycerol---prolipoprotein diacylglyceryl transferase
MNLAFLSYPQWITPEVIPGLPIRWYGVMYLLAFGTAYLMVQWQRKKEKFAFSDDDVASYFFWGIIGLLLGARILAATVYDPTGYYLRQPWLIFWPFDGAGNFTGLQGMSYHGGVLGAMAGTWLFTRRKKQSWFEWADLVVVGIPLGYTFGRLGNFLNGELYGRVTSLSWGMIFPGATRFPVSLDWVRDLAARVGMNLPASGTVNLPRHPSQLYEAFFEGVFLWAILWFIFRKRKKFHGALLSLYLMGYGFVRFLIEYTREPDRDLGFPIELVETNGEIYRFVSFFNFSTGQILCFLMILSGALLYGILSRIGTPVKEKGPDRVLPPSAKKRRSERSTDPVS